MDSPEQRAAFLDLYRADVISDIHRSLVEYQERFPGHEEAIAEEWSCLEPDRDPAEPASTTTRETDSEQLGPYRILKQIGRGAQATVYLAEHETLRRRVALKVLTASVAEGSAAAMARFRREAEVSAQLDHPAICSVYEADLTHETPWIAMQLVHGETLADKLRQPGAARRSSVGIERDLGFFEQVARALHVAHLRGLVHRDIKPGNLMVRSDGHPVILDFGLARITDDPGHGLTRTEDMLGTPYYLAPEQLQSKAADGRTDVFALGVTMFEALTGTRPFDAPSREALFRQTLHEEPPAPRDLNSRLSRDLEVTLQTALAKDPAQRYESALALAEDLRRLRCQQPILARPVSSWGRLVRWARRNPAVAVAISLSAATLLAALSISLVALDQTTRTVRERSDALTALQVRTDQLYEVLSSWQARAVERGERMPEFEDLDWLVETLLERAKPGLMARWRSMQITKLLSLDGFQKLWWRGAELVRGADRDDLSPLQQLCIADQYSIIARNLFELTDWERSSQSAAELVKLCERGVRIRSRREQHTPPWDLRTFLSRAEWLDAMLLAGDSKRVLAQVEASLEGLGSNHRFRPRYELRRARALTQLGSLAEAQSSLAAAAAAMGDLDDGDVAGVELSRAWIDLLDARGDASGASRWRTVFARGLARRGDIGLRNGKLLFADRKRIWNVWRTLHTASARDPATTPQLLRELEQAMQAARVTVPGPEAAYLAHWVASDADVITDQGHAKEAAPLAEAAMRWSAPSGRGAPFPVYSYAVTTFALAKMQLDQHSDVEPALRAILAAEDGTINPTYETAAVLRSALGQCLLRRGPTHFEEAEQLLSRAVNEIRGMGTRGVGNGNLYQAHWSLLELYARDGRMQAGFEPSRRHLIALMEFDSWPGWRNGVSWGVVRVPGQRADAYALARVAMRAAITKVPGRASFWLTLALAEHRCGDSAAALSALDRCRQLSATAARPLPVPFPAVLVLVLAGAGRPGEARDTYASARGQLDGPNSAAEHEAAAFLREAESLGVELR